MLITLLTLQADVGLALLSGHANANTTEDIVKPDAIQEGSKDSLIVADERSSKSTAEDALNAREQVNQ
jgi:hypothetical protein